MNLVMYVFINKGLGMSEGKVASQAVQAAIGGYIASTDKKKDDWWRKGGHHTTLVMEARDEQHLMNIQHYLEERGFKSNMQVDEGMTEIAEYTMTALGVEIVDKEDEHTDMTFSSFKLYKPKLKVTLEIDK